MNYQNIARAKAIEQENKKRLLKLNPKLNDKSGIYFLLREDENGFKYAYIGQAVHTLATVSTTAIQEIMSLVANVIASRPMPTE